MRIKIKYIFIFLIPVLASACGRGKGSNVNEDTLQITVPDSVMPDSLIPDTVTPPKAVLKTTDEILTLIQESPDRSRYEAGILPTMAKEVPEYAGKLLASDAEGFLIVDKNTMKIFRYDRYGVEQERVGIAVAKNFGSKHKRRDGRTPEGFFTIEGIYDSTEWLFTDDDGNTSQVKGQFGPRYMRLRTPVSSQIGIHGTVAPWSIGGRRSHGCIRMTNENILRFVEICKPGWPVIVSPGPKDMAVNESEGYDIPSVTVIPGRPRCKPGKKIVDPLPEESVDTKSVDSPSSDSSKPLDLKLDEIEKSDPASPESAGERGDTIHSELVVPSDLSEI